MVNLTGASRELARMRPRVQPPPKTPPAPTWMPPAYHGRTPTDRECKRCQQPCGYCDEVTPPWDD